MMIVRSVPEVNMFLSESSALCWDHLLLWKCECLLFGAEQVKNDALQKKINLFLAFAGMETHFVHKVCSCVAFGAYYIVILRTKMTVRAQKIGVK